MLDVYAAEALKIRRHKATWFLVWVYPILFAAIFIIAFVLGITGIDGKTSPQTATQFVGDTAIIWVFPAQTIGRVLIAAFVAVVFAGEYGWNTWKLVVPHRSRPALIAGKYAVVITLFMAAFAMTALIATFGTIAKYWSTGDAIPNAVTASLLLRTHGSYALAAVAPFAVTLGYASLAAILTRSTIASLVISIVVLTAEELLFKLAPVISAKLPLLIDVTYPVLPGYHLANMSQWITEGAGLQTKFPDGSLFAQSLATSTAVTAAWAAVLVAGTFVAFKRQDIN